MIERICLLTDKRGLIVAENAALDGDAEAMTREEMPDGRVMLRVPASELPKALAILERAGFTVAREVENSASIEGLGPVPVSGPLSSVRVGPARTFSEYFLPFVGGLFTV